MPEDIAVDTDVSDAISIDTDSTDEAPEQPQVEEKLISQTDLDRIVQKRLKRQEEQFLKKFGDYEERVKESESFRKLQDEKSTDAERWEKERNQLLSTLQEKDQALTKLQRANLIADLASERGLPKTMWKRVQGETEEEIAEDMDSIINDLGLKKAASDASKEKTPATRKGTVYGGGGETEDPDPDTDAIVSKIPRGPQIRIEKPRAYK